MGETEEVSSHDMPPFGHNPEKCREAVSEARKGLTGSGEAI